MSFTRALPLSIAVALTGGGSAPPAGGTLQSGTVPVGARGERVSYIAGGAGCPVVFVGGGSAMDVRQWEETIAHLPGRFTTIGFDPRGIGRSDAAQSTYSDEDDLLRVFDALGLKRAVVAGNSSAGGLAFEFAIAHPDRVEGVVAVAPFITGWEFSDAMRQRVERLGVAMDAGADSFIEAVFADPHFIPAPESPDARPRARDLIREGFATMTSTNPALTRAPETPLIKRIGGIAAPTLLLVGELDHDDLHRRVAFLHETIEGSTVVRLAGSGHTPTLEKPELLASEIGRFLDAIDWSTPERCR